MSKAGELIVCDSVNHRVQLFELRGKFVTKFGTEGGQGSELKKPISTAVLNDVKIVVSDFCDNPFLIFE